MAKYVTVDEIRAGLSKEDRDRLCAAQEVLDRLLEQSRQAMRPQMSSSLANAAGVLALYASDPDDDA